MVLLNTIQVFPALINTSCAWSSSIDQLQALYDSPYTGAITTRTATLEGYDDRPDAHMVHFATATVSTINSFGYSPHPLAQYLQWVETIVGSSDTDKPVIISLTSSDVGELKKMVDAVQSLRTRLNDVVREGGRPCRIAIEINTSCPNIANSSPSGYTMESMKPLLQVLVDAFAEDNTLTIGLKLPPYTFQEQFVQTLKVLDSFVDARGVSPITFVTSTNTLGSSLLFPDQAGVTDTMARFALPTPLGGVAGDLLHPLALGNVYTLAQKTRGRDAQFNRLSNLKIIGVGGVTSREAAQRMRDVGADIVGSATFFGKEGVKAFQILGA